MKTYRGRVENGRVVLAKAAKLPEGAAVRVTIEPKSRPRSRRATSDPLIPSLEDQKALEACFREAERDYKAGRYRPVAETIAELDAKRRRR